MSRQNMSKVLKFMRIQYCLLKLITISIEFYFFYYVWLLFNCHFLWKLFHKAMCPRGLPLDTVGVRYLQATLPSCCPDITSNLKTSNSSWNLQCWCTPCLQELTFLYRILLNNREMVKYNFCKANHQQLQSNTTVHFSHILQEARSSTKYWSFILKYTGHV